MKIHNLTEVKVEMRRLKDRIKDLEIAQKEKQKEKPNSAYYSFHCVEGREAAAVKRASLDLTHALARLRK